MEDNFRKQAKSQGFTDQEIDEFLGNVNTQEVTQPTVTPPETQPSVAPAPTPPQVTTPYDQKIASTEANIKNIDTRLQTGVSPLDVAHTIRQRLIDVSKMDQSQIPSQSPEDIVRSMQYR
jgi:hypothetical protein